MSGAQSHLFRLPPALRLTVALLAAVWAMVAAFPLLWITVMSFREPIDALSSAPLTVLLGPATRAADGGLSVLALLLGAAAVLTLGILPGRFGAVAAQRLAPQQLPALGWLIAGVIYVAAAALLLLLALPAAIAAADWLVAPIPLLRALGTPLVGVTLRHYRAVWITHEFTRNFDNSMIVTFGVVTVSLSVGTLAGYGLARTRSQLAFWLLAMALVFRALPQSVLVTGYIPAFLNSPHLLAPLWNWPATGWLFHLFAAAPPTLYGQPLAIIVVLVAINQPFTIWMLRSFFENIPAELDEAARVDGCTDFGAFRRVIMPVMWPGVITAGLFSFLLAYNDYMVSALLLDQQSMTMVPAITQFLNRDTRAADQIEAIAAAVSITAPLFLLVMVFQRQIVAGLTQGAVKG